MTTVSGDPAALSAFSATMLAAMPGLDSMRESLSAASAAYNLAPSDLGHTVAEPDVGDHIARLRDLGALPAAFAFALRRSDEMGPLIIHTINGVAFEDLAGLWLSQHDPGRADTSTTDDLAEGFLAEIFSTYSANGDAGPLKVALGALRVFRTYAYLQEALRVPASPQFTVAGSRTLGLPSLVSRSAVRFPTTNTGIPAQMLGRYVPRAASFLQSPMTTATLRWTGIAGGTYGTVTGVINLVEQGNPVDAFQREGAGYVADVSGTLFSASTTAFLIAPNPITGGAVIVTGVVWAGAEIWDHREAIGDWTGDRWDDVSSFTSARVDDVAGFAGDRLDDVGSVASTVNDHMPWNWG